MKYEFCEYYSKRQNLDNIIESIILEANSNPEFLEILQEAGFFHNLKNAGSQLWKGIQGGAQAAYSQMTGPATQFQNSISALEKALVQIQKDPNWSKSATTGSPSIKSMPLMNWLQETIRELNNQKGQFANKQMAEPQTVAAQPAAGATYDPAATKFS